MILWTLIERSLAQRKLSSVLTALNVALGVMLVCSILLLQDELERTYGRQSRGYDMVVGPTGSPLQLVLNSVFHLDQSPGLISHHVWRELASPEKARYVRLAVPYAVGDSFRGYRVVATTDAVFHHYFPFPEGATIEEKFALGRPFRFTMEALDEALAFIEGRARDGGGPDHLHGIAEAVLGWGVASSLNLHVGDEIEPTHGVEGAQEHDHEHLWKVCGILKETGTAIDDVVFINLDSFYRIAEHAAGGLLPGAEKPTAGLSSVVLFARGGVGKPFLLNMLTKRPDVQVADVGQQVRNLRSIVGNVDQVFFLVAVMVVIIGVVSIMVAVYNTMNERRRELAIMRAIGARRSLVMAAIVGESATLAFLGALVGILLGHGLVALQADRLQELANMRVDPLRVLPAELMILGAVTLVGALAGFLPAAKAYRTDVAENLTPLS